MWAHKAPESFPGFFNVLIPKDILPLIYLFALSFSKKISILCTGIILPISIMNRRYFIKTPVALLLLLLLSLRAAAQPPGRDPITPDPIDVDVPYGGEREPGGKEYGGRGVERPGTGKPGGKTPSTPVSRKATIQINGQTFTISADAESRVKDFFRNYKDQTQVGGFVAAIASIFTLFDLFNINSEFPAIDVIFKTATFDANEVVLKLSAVNVWNRAMRAQAAGIIESEMALALARGQTQEAKMWRMLRDIIANPERYQNGGIKWDAKEKKLMLRSLPAEAYRSVAGFTETLTPADISQLGALTNTLTYYAASRDFIIYADYIYELHLPYARFQKITMHDRMLLNKALLVLPPGVKNYLDGAMLHNAGNPSMTYALWSKLRKFLANEEWNMGRVPDVSIDALGFTNDDLPQQSDLVLGQYPAPARINTQIPAAWAVPQNQQLAYRFFWQSQGVK